MQTTTTKLSIDNNQKSPSNDNYDQKQRLLFRARQKQNKATGISCCESQTAAYGMRAQTGLRYRVFCNRRRKSDNKQQGKREGVDYGAESSQNDSSVSKQDDENKHAKPKKRPQHPTPELQTTAANRNQKQTVTLAQGNE